MEYTSDAELATWIKDSLKHEIPDFDAHFRFAAKHQQPESHALPLADPRHTIGHGSYATVYAAHSIGDNKTRLAAKETRLFDLNGGLRVREIAQAIREAAIIQGLNRVTNFAPKLCRVTKTRFGLQTVTEYLPGDNLADQICKENCNYDIDRNKLQLTPLEIDLIIIRLCQLNEITRKLGVLWIDQKPDNIITMTETNGRKAQTRMFDFNLSQILHSQDPQSLYQKIITGQLPVTAPNIAIATSDPNDNVMGTPTFMAPETAYGDAQDHRTDLYTTGCIYYLLKYGKVPFNGGTVTTHTNQNYCIMLEQAECPPQFPENPNDHHQELIKGLLAKDPNDRPPDAITVINHIWKIIENSAGPQTLSTIQATMQTEPRFSYHSAISRI